MGYAVDRGVDGCRVVAALICDPAWRHAIDGALFELSAYRCEKALAFRFDKDRRLSLLAGLLLDELLKERGLRERDRTYLIGERGKPSFGDLLDLHFSLAHSREMAVAALADVPIGVDVEYLPGFPRDIADPREWTAMESVGKALGCGIAPFVDGGTFTTPPTLSAEHLDLGDYLVCVAAPPPWPRRLLHSSET